MGPSHYSFKGRTDSTLSLICQDSSPCLKDPIIMDQKDLDLLPKEFPVLGKYFTKTFVQASEI